MNLKKELFIQCETFINNCIQIIKETIYSNQKALQSETKSSTGDKDETGRAMLQLEMEKVSQQSVGTSIMKEVLAKINISKISKKTHLGSVIFTDKANYFLSIFVRKLTVADKYYFSISVSSLIGKLLLGKEENNVINFKD